MRTMQNSKKTKMSERISVEEIGFDVDWDEFTRSLEEVN